MALEAGVMQWENFPSQEENNNRDIKVKFEWIKETNSEQQRASNLELKENDKKTDRAEVEYLSPNS